MSTASAVDEPLNVYLERQRRTNEDGGRRARNVDLIGGVWQEDVGRVLPAESQRQLEKVLKDALEAVGKPGRDRDVKKESERERARERS